MDENDTNKALMHLQQTEIHFNIAKLIVVIVVSIVTAFSIVYFLHQDHEKNLADIRRANAATATEIETKIDDSNISNKRFYCSMAIQLTHSTQSVDDCVTTNSLAETPNPKVLPLNGASANAPRTTIPQTSQGTSRSSNTPQSNPSTSAPPDNRSNIQKLTDGIKSIIKKL